MIQPGSGYFQTTSRGGQPFKPISKIPFQSKYEIHESQQVHISVVMVIVTKTMIILSMQNIESKLVFLPVWLK